ncbi:MAG TPA: nitroreductase/quinone reductase family protein [Pseudomonadales bacterium]|nr:nitroreductase/quinone reductase family protein [Pseudomonadales bacterium]
MLQLEPLDGPTVARPQREGGNRLILITQGRYSGRSEAALLTYRKVGNDFLVVAANRERGAKPDWYLNLKEEPVVQIEISDARFYARAWTPTGQTRLGLLPIVADITQRVDKSIPRETAAILLTPMC